MFAAVHAYTAARQEIEILQSLRHPNIVELLGIVVHPLALILALAPHGSLNTILKVYRDKQDMLPVFAVKCVISQVSLEKKQILFTFWFLFFVRWWNVLGPTRKKIT